MKQVVYRGLQVFIVLLATHASFADTAYYRTNPQGWHWNDMPLVDQHKLVKPKTVQATSQVSNPLAVLHRVQRQLQAAKALAVLQPTVANTARFYAMQHWISERATQFAQTSRLVMLLYPSLDYGLQHPSNTQADQLAQLQHAERDQQRLHQLAQTDVLIFFYRGGQALDQLLAKTVAQFAAQANMSLLGAPMDHRALAVMPKNLTDFGQAATLGVKALPALVLVNPTTRESQVVVYGAFSQAALPRLISERVTQYQEVAQ